MIWQLLYQEVISKNGLFHSVPTVRLAQSQLYSAHTVTKSGEERSHRRGGEVPSDLLEQWRMAEVCSQVVPGMNLWNLWQGSSRNQCSHTGCDEFWGQEPPPTGAPPFPGKRSGNGETDMWGCFFPAGLVWTFSEHRAEHTAAIPKDWPASLTRSPTAGCSEQLRILKNKLKKKTYRTGEENKPPAGRMMRAATERSLFICSSNKKKQREPLRCHYTKHLLQRTE